MLASSQFVLSQHPDTSRLLEANDGSNVDLFAYARSMRKLRASVGSPSVGGDLVVDDKGMTDSDVKIMAKMDSAGATKVGEMAATTTKREEPETSTKDDDDAVVDDPDKPITSDDGKDCDDDDDGEGNEGGGVSEQGDEDDEDERQWGELETGKFIKQCGSISIVSFGASQSAVCITTVHPGYYK